MSIYEEISKRISKNKQNLNQKSKGDTELSWLNSQIDMFEKKIIALYTEIGKKYCEKHDLESADEEYISLYQEINENKEKILSCNQKILFLKGMKRCVNCGAELSIEVAFCPYCGTKVESEISEENNSFICPRCKCAVEEGQAFCTNCGEKLPDKIVYGNDELTEAEDDQTENKGFCTNCGCKLETGVLFCPNCGTKI